MTSAPSIDRDQILQAYPLEEVMQQGGVEFTRIQGRLMCKCPFHADGTPSLSVDLEKGLWKCFGCNKGGTSIDFIAFSTGEDSKAVYRRLATELTGASPAPRKQLQPKARPVDAPKEEKVKDNWPVPGKDTGALPAARGGGVWRYLAGGGREGRLEPDQDRALRHLQRGRGGKVDGRLHRQPGRKRRGHLR